MSENDITSSVIIEDEICAVKVRKSGEIRVVVRTPEKLHERVRQRKINQIYDILNPKIAR